MNNFGVIFVFCFSLMFHIWLIGKSFGSMYYVYPELILTTFTISAGVHVTIFHLDYKNSLLFIFSESVIDLNSIKIPAIQVFGIWIQEI